MVSNIETINLKDLQVFEEVARRLSVTATGEALGMPKSAVSKALTRLEAQLGVKLLERSSRRMAPTDAGRLVQLKGEALLAEAAFLRQSLVDERDLPRGIVHMTAPTELGIWFVDQVLPDLSAHYPELKISLKLGYPFDDVLDPALDIALRIHEVHDDRLVATTIGHVHRIAVASPQWLARNPIAHITDLALCNCLIFSATDTRQDWTFIQSDISNSVSVSGNLAALSFSALLHAARDGMGVACVPEFSAREWLQRGELVQVLPGWRSPAAPVFMARRFGHEKIARVRAVLDVLRTHPWLNADKN